jgi:hypothetical protein
MVKQELIQRSPVRVFEKSIGGGLKPGETGVIASPTGIGKTSVLVQIALDKLLQSQKVIHVSFTQHKAYVLAWYENIFEEVLHKQGLQNISEVKDELIKNRVIMHFNQDMKADQVVASLKSMIKDGGFNAESIIIDGFDFAKSAGHLEKIKAFAQELDISVWYSCNTKEGTPPESAPAVLNDCIDLFEVVIILDPKPDHVSLSVSKSRSADAPPSSPLRLDPQPLLILKH